MKKYLILLLLSFTTISFAQEVQNLTNVWGDIDADVSPWVSNTSRPHTPSHGLQGRHLSLWASHGRYYDQDKAIWKWQRPNLFATTEDLFTQTIVVPYLIPMLENAGAYVFTPRERDWQKEEYIISNDCSWPNGSFSADIHHTEEMLVEGYAVHDGIYEDGENPFKKGTALILKSTKKDPTIFCFTPFFQKAGRYAVYVCYPEVGNAVDDVHYTVHHKGIKTEFVVNQQMGYDTWVYLGTFDFDAVDADDDSMNNCVTMSNFSKEKGNIGIDAVRFGGGMGNIVRGGTTSGLPRCLEGARYYGQWAGAPYTVYSDKMGVNDYGDDINVRSLMTNWVGGGSCFMPNTPGLKVPIELSLAIHSDAGYNEDGESVYGSLAIATTNFNDGLLDAGITRQTSLDFACMLRDNLNTDMLYKFGNWDKRYLWDRNYSETRLPAVPSAIIETLSHQSFPDMKIAQHPEGKFAIARSLYKTILKYVSSQHNRKYVVQPLAPTDFHMKMVGKDRLQLTWSGVIDSQEETSAPTSYNIYTSIDGGGFDNGQNTESNSVELRLNAGVQYNFRITACNDGGESFPTPTLSAYISPNPIGNVLVVDGFERLSAPYIIENDTLQGFDLNRDEGVQRGIYAGWSGAQYCFNKSTMGQLHEAGLGYSGDELIGQFIAGNDFTTAVQHTEAIASAKQYNIISTSLSALNKGYVHLEHFNVVDLAFGLQKDDSQLGLHYKTFTPTLMNYVERYLSNGGKLLVSGSYIGSDMLSADESVFCTKWLKYRYENRWNEMASCYKRWNGRTIGLGMEYDVYNAVNPEHYAATHAESIVAEPGAICAMAYSNGISAAVGFKGTYSTMSAGFPLECIKNKSQRNSVMQGLLAYLMGN